MLKLLNRIATVKDDGTVEFEVPGDVEPHTFGVGSGTEKAQSATNSVQVLSLDYGHRVRLATRSNFKDFVLTAGLEFYPLGGDPKILAGYMIIYLGNMFSRHTHVAEALKVPLHVFFTMLWTPTSEFPHLLSRAKQSAGYRLSYQIVDSLIWLGIRDMVNDLRMKKLKLWPVTYFSGSQGSESEVHIDTFGVLTSFPNQK
ncbi:unnamed protein product [Camellia sinensis]